MITLHCCCMAVVAALALRLASAQQPHVLIVGVDGLGSFWAKEEELSLHAPTITQLASTGVISYSATAYYLTDSKPKYMCLPFVL